ncbi:hypothetical protein BD626DRAFT_404528 [Schizophyllum amplum]|uniref:Mediator of RNA polymerase II transcription subunit 22 n=1 Tax=Schizophyllum amplum TaxID=97359 RepID=A0A550CCB4_9AGAR|nr:hypothetical protein BD626DRAFT_404528 [Auriculariopsis ampla]
MADPYIGDVSRPAALPSANFLQRSHNQNTAAEQNSTQYLDAIEEEWNKKVDTEVGTLVDNMVELVGLASVRAANSLLSITHSLKLLLLLSDEAQIAHRRDVELKNVEDETKDTKQKVAALLDELLRPPSSSRSDTPAADGT